MDSFEASTHVFIIRVWLEPRENTLATPVWRGVIEHVPTRQRQYFEDLTAIPDFIELYFEQSGTRLSLRGRLHRWAKKILP